jgi:hypothetical protein
LATKKAPKTDPLAALADELGALEKELAPWKGKISRAEALRKEIRAQAPDTQSEITGEKFLVTLGPRADETHIDYFGIAKRIGFDRFAKFATATQKALAEHVRAGILAQYLTKKATGTRSMKVFEKGQIA